MTTLLTEISDSRIAPPHGAIDRLHALARNLWWSWDPDGRRLFEWIDPKLWVRVEHNPVALLRKLPPATLEALAADTVFAAEVERVYLRFTHYLTAPTWFERRHGATAPGLVAYFSMEFGLHESLPIFAGGLGVLAGDHFKSATDLGLPLVGVGMFWRRGYTRQRIDAKGRQVDRFDTLDPRNLPLWEVCGPQDANVRAATVRERFSDALPDDNDGGPVRLRVPVGADTVAVRAWRLDVGRVPIFLLDTNLPENAPKHRKLTEKLYIGARDTRIRQEIVLGVGGWMLMRALGLPVAAAHLNEGHAAFCSLARVAETMKEQGCMLAQAVSDVAAATIFTTHTPVAVGNEAFEPALVRKYFGDWAQRTGIGWDKLATWGRTDTGADAEPFGMTPLALRIADRCNGVSRLHGEVSRKMWQPMYPRKSVKKVPIGSITNGIHVPTWMHPAMAALLDEFLPADWRARHDEPAVWKAVASIPDGQLWATHMTFKEELCDFIARRQQRGLATRWGTEPLDPQVLTIGFARRFAPYKRPALIFSDLRRLERIVSSAKRPVQIIFAGKAHPADVPGKACVAEVAKHAASRRFKGRVVLLADYDMDIARHLVAGVDVWLNNPRRPQEASGTSGMKPALHGGLNLSILDGWWPEACKDGVNGWSIGKPVDHDGSPAADKRDAQSLYARLEKDVIPLYYKVDRNGLPKAWIGRMKKALTTIPAKFSSHRMVKEYLERCYLPVLQ